MPDDRPPMPEHLQPMLARPGTMPADESRWSFEVKWDGVRAIAYIVGGTLRLESRNLREITASYPEVAGLVDDLDGRDAVLDGEVVAFADDGRPSFERLQSRMHVTAPESVGRLATSVPVVYAIFDLVYLDGELLTGLPYEERRQRLEALQIGGPAWRVPEVRIGAGSELFGATRAAGLEGIVAKRLDSRYEPGARNGSWVKIKHTHRQELVIGGWLPGAGRRTDSIGSLLMGYHDEDAAELHYAGRVGTGFTERTLADLAALLAALRRSASPFAGAPKLPREAVFVEPRLVAEIEFVEWTADGVMRAPSFKGLRDDKPAADVVREDPVESPFEVVEELRGGGRVVRVGNRQLQLSNWDKVLFPRTGFTKGDLVLYYARVAGAVLPHLRDRALTLKRYPNGVDRPYFYEKNSPSHRPDWVPTAEIGGVDYTLAQEPATLVWLANLADVELHTSLALASAPQRPTMLVFDLDPGAPAGIAECCEVALVVHRMFAALGLESAAKTSGSKGLQVYVPLNGEPGEGEELTYRRTKPFAKQVAELLEQRLPDLVVSRMSKNLRAGRVFVDWSQNDAHKTTVTVYSVRALAQPGVSTPVSWEEVAACHERRDPELLSFTPDQVLARIAAHGDLFAPVAELRQRLPAL